MPRGVRLGRAGAAPAPGQPLPLYCRRLPSLLAAPRSCRGAATRRLSPGLGRLSTRPGCTACCPSACPCRSPSQPTRARQPREAAAPLRRPAAPTARLRAPLTAERPSTPPLVRAQRARGEGRSSTTLSEPNIVNCVLLRVVVVACLARRARRIRSHWRPHLSTSCARHRHNQTYEMTYNPL